MNSYSVFMLCSDPYSYDKWENYTSRRNAGEEWFANTLQKAKDFLGQRAISAAKIYTIDLETNQLTVVFDQRNPLKTRREINPAAVVKAKKAPAFSDAVFDELMADSPTPTPSFWSTAQIVSNPIGSF